MLADRRPDHRALGEDNPPIPTYEAASWGPTDADRLIGRHGRKWRKS